MRLFLIIIAVLATAAITSYTLRQVMGTPELPGEPDQDPRLTVEELIERGVDSPSPTPVPSTPEPSPTPLPSPTASPTSEPAAGSDTDDSDGADPNDADETVGAVPVPRPVPDEANGATDIPADDAATLPEAAPQPTPADTTTPTAPPVVVSPQRQPAATAQTLPPNPDATAWWAATVDDEQLDIIYVGLASFDRAIAVLLDGGFDSPESANAHLEVLRDGTVIDGDWQVSSANQNLLYFPLRDGGRYEITLGAGLTDRDGRSWPVTRRGSVALP
jgi:hypothetical protein